MSATRPPSSSEPTYETPRAPLSGQIRALEERWADPEGFVGWFRSLQNDAIGTRIMTAAFVFFLLGGLAALLLRTQLIRPENTLLGADRYNELFTIHGSTMMYLFAVPILEGFAILILPAMLGSREMPFPRLGVFSFFTYVLGGAIFFASFLFNAVPDTGWFAYVPLSGAEFSPGVALDFWLLALGVAEVAAIAAGIEIIIAILHMRAPGMSLSRLPLFAWAMLVMAFMLLFAFTVLLVGSLMLELDRKIGTAFFDPNAGGNPLLWQHLFWIFGHPEVYIQFIPVAGMVSMMIPAFTRRRISGYTFIALSLVAIGFLSFGLWIHHMFTVDLPPLAMSYFSAASFTIAIPTGVMVLAWISTIWFGRPQFKTPFLFVLGFIAVFVLGGITGVMVGSLPFDLQVHDSYFVVAHFHYVLIGGVVFPLFAALYYWIPWFTGKLLNEPLGKWNFWLMFVGFNVTFFPMHLTGLLGMPRRVYTYSVGSGWESYNLVSTLGSYLLAAGVLVFVINVVYSLRRGETAGYNPWGSESLEWSQSSPPINFGYSQPPIVRSRFPLWDQDSLDEGPEKVVALVRRMAEWPVQWRAALTTSLLDARPREVFRVSGPSLWPFVTALGVITIFGSEIFSLRLIGLLGIITVVVGSIGWNWPQEIPTDEVEEGAFGRLGVEVRPHGSRVVSRWGMGLFLLVIGTALAALLFSYFNIRLANPDWPPAGIPVPNLILPAAAGLLLLLSAGSLYWARRQISRDLVGRLRVGLAAAFLLGLAAVAVLSYDYLQLPFGPDTNAYGSLVWIIGIVMFLLLLGGLIMNALGQFWAWRGAYSAGHFVGVEVIGMYWTAIVAASVLVFGTLYLGPYLA